MEKFYDVKWTTFNRVVSFLAVYIEGRLAGKSTVEAVYV
jgi:hypothetical protein